MIREQCEQEVKGFLKHYPTPTIRTATTMYKGYVVCIAPIKGICGAELMCNPATRDSLVELIRNNQ